MKLTSQEALSRSTPVQENMPVQQWLWRVERWGLWLMLAVVLLTLLGLFSKGPLSSRELRSDQGTLGVAYERFLRNGATSTLVITAHGQPNATLTITLDGDLLDGLTVEGITPTEQQAATFGKTGLQLQLRTDASGQARAHVEIRADGLGRYHSVLASAGQRLELNFFVYP